MLVPIESAKCLHMQGIELWMHAVLQAGWLLWCCWFAMSLHVEDVMSGGTAEVLEGHGCCTGGRQDVAYPWCATHSRWEARQWTGT